MNKPRFLALLMSCVCSIAAAADLDREVQFDIPAQALLPALYQFSEQAKVQVVTKAADVSNATTHGVSGRLTVNKGLDELLRGTGFAFEATDASTIAITTKEVPLVLSEQRNEAASSSSELKDSEEPANQLEEILVTAQKRPERAFDVPISMVVLGADELLQRNVTSLDDLSLAVPGLAIQSSGGFQRRIMMRGVSNTQGSSSLIGLYLDEASVTSATPVAQLDLRAYDLERVEVLRGPQGTLYGEGSAGGTIRFITQKPQLDQFAMNADFAALLTEDGEPGGRAEAVLNIPLVEDKLGLRFAGIYDRQGGWMDQPAVNREDYNDQELVNVRAKVLWQPVPQLSMDAMAVIHRNEAAPNVGEDDDGNYLQTFNLLTTPAVEDDYEVFNLTLSYDFAAVRLLSTTTHVEQDKRIRNQGFRFQFTPPGTPTSDSHFLDDARGGEVLTQEVRLVSSDTGRWQWTIGGFYQDILSTRELFQYFGATGAPGTPLPPLGLTRTRLLVDSWAAFGDVSYRLTDRFTLGTGLRYFESDQEFRSGATLAVIQKELFDSLNPRVYAQYELTDRANLYASAAKGFRTGGFNTVITRPPYDPETVWTYELGTKMSLAEGRVRTELAIFHTDYSDYQIFGFLPQNPSAGNLISNAGDAEVRGVELSFAWHPTDRWTLGLNGNYVDAEFVEINVDSSSYAVGDPLDLFPEYSYTVSAQRDWSWNGRASFARIDYNELGKMNYRNRQFGPWYFGQSDIINMLNLNVSTQWSETVSLGLFVQNLLDDRGFTDPFGIDENAARSRPRTYGIEFGMTF